MGKKLLSILLMVAMVITLLPAQTAKAEVESQYRNPLMRGADPTITRDADGFYYCCFGTDNDIYLKRAETVLGISTAKSRLVWEKPESFGYVWGPYIYRLEGKWYIYFASGPETDFGYGHPSTYVLENESPDPFEGTWELKGSWSNRDADGKTTEKAGLMNAKGYGLPCGVITMGGERYYTYTKYFYYKDNYLGTENGPAESYTRTKFDECPTIVKMLNPWTLDNGTVTDSTGELSKGTECTLARPVYDWEKFGDNINEGCAVVEKDGKVYFAYSASSFMNDNYAVGVSYADLSSDLLNPNSWQKLPVPLMQKSPENSSYGPGSPLFVKSEDGTEDWLIHHAGPVGGQTGSNRWVRATPVSWTDHGFVNVGVPSNPGTVFDRPSGEEKSEVLEAEDATCVNVEKRIISDSARSSGSGNVKLNQAGGYVEFEVEAESTGMYSLDFRYNNIVTGSAISLQLSVNDSQQRTLSFESNGEYTANLDILKVYNISLLEGTNKIRITAPESCELILDALTIKKTTLYEAEEATMSGNAKASTEHLGYSGSGYVDNLYSNGSGVAFTVNAPYTGNYSVDLRFCNGFYGEKINKSLAIYVNGVRVKTADCFYGTSWSDWQDRYDNLNLKQGLNTIEYKYDDASLGNVNIDYITVTQAVTMTYEAEQAELTGGASFANDHTGYTGTGFVGGLWQNGAVEFSVNVETAATYDVAMKYALALPDGPSRNMKLYINGEFKETLTFTDIASWDKWGEKVVALELNIGNNTIKLAKEEEGQGDINLDNIHLQRRIPWAYQAENATIIVKEEAAVTRTYEAEQAVLTGSAIVATDHPGYTGTGFVGGLWQDGAVEFSVDVETTATYDVAMKYALGFIGETRNMNLYINGAFKETITFTDSGSWDSWGQKVVAMELTEGKNTIILAREGVGQGDINLDNIHLQVTTYEAEKAKLSGGASVAIDHPGYSGTGFVAGLWQDGAIEFSVDVVTTGSYDVAMKYALGFIGETRDMNLYINGVFKKALTFTDTGSWDSWGEKVVAMDLNEGNNIIKLVREEDGQGDINLDNIHLQRRELNEGNNTIILAREEGQGDISLDNIDLQVTTYEAYQAENASIKVGKHDDHLWYEGTGYVGGFENVSEGIEFTVNVPYTGTNTATVRYSGVQENNMTMSLYVNGNKINQIAFPPTKDWDEWAESTFDVQLNAGNNTIKIVREIDDSGCLNIDSLTIDKYSSAKSSLKNPGLVSGTVYVMKSKTSGKAADVAGYSRDAGALVNQWNYLGNINQLWELLDQGNGYWKLMSSFSGHMLDVADTTNYFTCQQTNDQDSLSQQWKIEQVGDFYKLTNRQYGMVLEVVGGLADNGTMIRLAAYEEGADRQLWKIADGFDATGIKPVEETPGGETPGEETPGEETPGGETPGEETPGEETPGGETPGEETPGEETPGEETPGGNTGGSTGGSTGGNMDKSFEDIVLEDADLKDGSYSLPTDRIVKKITGSKDSVVNVVVNHPNSKSDASIILEAEILVEAAKAGKTLSVTVKDENDKVVYTWSFDNDQLKQSQNMKDVDLTLNICALNENASLKNVIDGNGIVMNFAYSGVLPAQASVKAYVGNIDGVKAGNKIYLYHVNKNTGKLEVLPYSSNYFVDAQGYLMVEILHCSDYVALTKEAPKDMYISLIDQIKVTPVKKSLTIGKNTSTSIKIELPSTLQLVNDLKDKTTQSAIGAVTVSYSSSNKKVATVDKNGKITAVGIGKSVITTTMKLYSGQVKKVKTEITVECKTVTVTKHTSSMKLGSEFTFSAKASGSDHIIWTTAKKSIVVIDKKTGVAKAKAKGTDYVVMTAGDTVVKIKVVVK